MSAQRIAALVDELLNVAGENHRDAVIELADIAAGAGTELDRQRSNLTAAAWNALQFAATQPGSVAATTAVCHELAAIRATLAAGLALIAERISS